LTEYFIVSFTMRNQGCQWMLIDAFIGILTGLAGDGDSWPQTNGG
jgi:hypothetical protein